MIGGLGEKLRARVTAGLERAQRLRQRRRLRRGSDDRSDCAETSPWSPRRGRLINGTTPEPPADASTPDYCSSQGSGDELEHGLYRLHVNLRHGRHLLAMDSCGTSDPYVKFKLAGKVLFKSAVVHKTLNPVWEETFALFLQDPFQNLHIQAYDYDWGVNDDFLGQAAVDLCTLQLDSEKEVDVPLCDTDGAENGGVVTIHLRLESLSQEQVDEMSGAAMPDDEHQWRLASGHWSHVLHVLLVSATGLLNMDADDTSDPYVKFRLGREKYKSRVVFHTLEPEWLEAFELYVFQGHSDTLDVELFDHDARTSDDFLGRCSVEVGSIERERTHDLLLPLQDGSGSVRLLLTVTAATQPEVSSDLLAHTDDQGRAGKLATQFGWRSLLHPRQPVGHLTVRVFKARGLAAADIGGRSDPYCVLQLVNQRRHTQTAYKTLTPHWNRIFTFDVGDMHTVLVVTVWDQDRDHQKDFLGRLHIPLLEVRSGERRWYSLKSQQLRERARGDDPQILLQLDIICCQLKAALRSFLPREKRLTRVRPKFKPSVLTNNINRMKTCTKGLVETYKMAGPILQWQSPRRTVAAYVAFLVVTFSFELHMLPALLLLAFGRGLMTHLVSPDVSTDDMGEDVDDDEEEDTIEKDDKKTLREKLAVVQEVATGVQTVLGRIDSLAESAENLCGFAVPFVSWLAVAVLVFSTALLYCVSLRVIIALLGTRMFAKHLFWPGSEFTNDMTNFLSCVPDHHQRHQRSELPALAECEDSAVARRRQRERYRRLRDHC